MWQKIKCFFGKHEWEWHCPKGWAIGHCGDGVPCWFCKHLVNKCKHCGKVKR